MVFPSCVCRLPLIAHCTGDGKNYFNHEVVIERRTCRTMPVPRKRLCRSLWSMLSYMSYYLYIGYRYIGERKRVQYIVHRESTPKTTGKREMGGPTVPVGPGLISLIFLASSRTISRTKAGPR